MTANPNSSPINAKIKSECASGRFLDTTYITKALAK